MRLGRHLISNFCTRNVCCTGMRYTLLLAVKPQYEEFRHVMLYTNLSDSVRNNTHHLCKTKILLEGGMDYFTDTGDRSIVSITLVLMVSCVVDNLWYNVGRLI